MRRIVPFLLLGLVTLSATSCKDEKKTDDIVAKVPTEPKQPTAPQKREASHWQQTIEWRGAKYTVAIDRRPDSTLVIDDSGQKYYDNDVTVKITRADGSAFVDKTFHKSDFLAAAKGMYASNGILLGMAFDQAKPDCLVFGGSIGNPNPDSDEFVPLSISIDPQGKASITEAAMDGEDEAMLD